MIREFFASFGDAPFRFALPERTTEATDENRTSIMSFNGESIVVFRRLCATYAEALGKQGVKGAEMGEKGNEDVFMLAIGCLTRYNHESLREWKYKTEAQPFEEKAAASNA